MWWSTIVACVAPPGPRGVDGVEVSPQAPDGFRLRVSQAPGLRDLVVESSAPGPWSWRVDGEDAGLTGPRVPASRLWPGQVWTVEGELDGERVRASRAVPEPPGGNLLVVVLDDVGIDHVAAYGLNPAAPPTPTLDELARTGVRFERAYASPVCSPTRGELLTGRHGRRTGLGWIVDTGHLDYALPAEAITLPEALRESRGLSWSNAALGKWHLAGPLAHGVLLHPLDQGFDHFAGTVGNPSYQEGRGYWRWDKNVDGVVSESTTYLTTDTADDALAELDALPEPWFLYVAFHAAHTPLSAPPPELVGRPPPPDAGLDRLYDATLEALDTELGRLLHGLGDRADRTTVVVLGDNGSPDHAIDPPFDPTHGKHTPFEGGVRVPLLVTGPHVAVPGSVQRALVHATDVFVLAAELGGVPLSGPDGALVLETAEPVPLDGRPMLPLLADPDARGREIVYSEGFSPNGPGPWTLDRRSVRDDRYELVRTADDPDRLFDLGPEPGLLEGPDRLASPTEDALRAWERLAAELDAIDDTLTYEGH